MIIKISQLRNISNCCDIHSISKNQYQVILARYLQFSHGCVNGKKAQVLKRPPHNVSVIAPIGHVWLLSAHIIYIFILLI